jgi:hypothetical protein
MSRLYLTNMSSYQHSSLQVLSYSCSVVYKYVLIPARDLKNMILYRKITLKHVLMWGQYLRNVQLYQNSTSDTSSVYRVWYLKIRLLSYVRTLLGNVPLYWDNFLQT